jgi:hypothetical protein
LLLPPLTLADLPTLLLPLPDDTHTPVPSPTGQPALTVTYPWRSPSADGSSCAAPRHGSAGQPGGLWVCTVSGHYAERRGQRWNRPQALSII